MFRSVAIAIILAAALCAGAFAQRGGPGQKGAKSEAPLVVKALGGGAYAVEGGNGANTGFIVTPKGVVTVDAKTTPESAKDFLAVIAKTTPNPVTNIILTHSDSDHVGGLSAFPKGLPIWAHETCKKEMLASAGPMAAPADYLPTRTAAGNQTLNIDGVRIDLLYFGPAHTSGDIVVYFPAQKLAYIGDLVMVEQGDPLLHAEKGGTPAGWFKVVSQIVALDASAFVSGHGAAPITKADIQKKLAATQEKYDRIKALVAQGQPLAEIRKAFGESEPAQGGRGFASFTEVAYNELTKK